MYYPQLAAGNTWVQSPGKDGTVGYSGKDHLCSAETHARVRDGQLEAV